MSTGELALSDVRLEFGGLVALNGVSLSVPRGQILGLIGPNGAGKSTVANVATGVYPPTRGSVLFDGSDVTQMPAYRRFRAGIARTFQNIRIFPQMSVLENVLIGADHRLRPRPLGLLFGTPGYRREMRAEADFCRTILETVGLAGKESREAAALSLRDQRRIEIGRALASQPKILLLDEPAAGLAENEIEELGELCLTLRDEGLGILLIEHDLDFVVRVSQRIIAMDAGAVLVEGLPDVVRNDPKVAEIYLGIGA